MRISDWSSDVCSSDLERQSGRTIKSPHGRELFVDAQRGTFDGPRVFGIDAVALRHCLHRVIADIAVAQSAEQIVQHALTQRAEIGRASCRERVCQYV